MSVHSGGQVVGRTKYGGLSMVRHRFGVMKFYLWDREVKILWREWDLLILTGGIRNSFKLPNRERCGTKNINPQVRDAESCNSNKLDGIGIIILSEAG